MVQQGYTKARYSTKASKRKAATGGGEDVAYPAGRATVQVWRLRCCWCGNPACCCAAPLPLPSARWRRACLGLVLMGAVVCTPLRACRRACAHSA